MLEQKERYSLVQSVLARLQLDQGLGVTHVSLPPSATVPAALPKPASPAPQPPASHTTRVVVPPSRPVAPTPESPADNLSRFPMVPYYEPRPHPERASLLAPWRDLALTCQKCPPGKTRRHPVWGEGALDCQLMFVGEAPGADEDWHGRPFVGLSGKLLTDILEKGMHIPRQEVYITNVLKCRPPGNRTPTPEECRHCFPFLEKQIAVIQPRILVALGVVAAKSILDLGPDSRGLRGHWHNYHGIPLRVLYHPSYLLRQRKALREGGHSDADRETWEDVKEILRLREELSV
ncbi:MAG: uracil-DNA glycosylase, partial [Planctomycetota bacterium]|nr:uracil-DNA glycosylase [Planctomycetota bacterium]